MKSLTYQPLERLTVPKPVDRIAYLVSRCRGKRVLDLGCYDETALAKRDTDHWLHGAIATAASSVLGIDASEQIPRAGLPTGPHSRIVRGDVTALDPTVWAASPPDIVVAGELLEHVPDALAFLRELKRWFPGKELVLTTPNATSLTNGLLALASRESNHPDHLQIYSFKTLHTLCLRAGFERWEIRPYHVRYTEMMLRASGLRRALVVGAETVVGWAERMFPLLGGGVVLDVTTI